MPPLRRHDCRKYGPVAQNKHEILVEIIQYRPDEWKVGTDRAACGRYLGF